jgi:hypothetical protein
LFLLSFQVLVAQERENPKLVMNGYVKNLQSLIFLDSANTYTLENLLHNRFNTKWFVNDNLTLHTSLRNRLFYGDSERFNDDFADLFEYEGNDFFDLDALLIKSGGIYLHSIIDRLYLEYIIDDLEIRLGRQRINWGINMLWNPNDIFNTYSFIDFDYEERPGSDALRVKYYTGFSSSVEFAIKAFEDWDEAVMAAMYKWNKWQYDFQVLSGVAYDNLMFGTGWAGNIKNAGFKGEMSLYSPLDSIDQLSISVALTIDYSFKNGIYLMGGYLFNNNAGELNDLDQLFSFRATPLNLYPYEHTTFVMAQYPFNPLINGSLNFVYSPGGANTLFISPSVGYSMANNWTLDLVSQIVAGNDRNDNYSIPVWACFLRIKWSF